MNGAAKMWIKGGTKGFLLDRLWKAYTDPPTPSNPANLSARSEIGLKFLNQNPKLNVDVA